MSDSASGADAAGAPPVVVLGTQLHVGAYDGHLDCDQHRQRAHHKAEAEDVVKVALHRSISAVVAAGRLSELLSFGASAC